MRIFICFMSLFLFSCSHSPNRAGQTPRPQIPDANMSPRHAVPKIAPESLFAQGQKSYQSKDDTKAFDYFISASQAWKDNPRELEAQFWAMRAAVRLGRWSETLALSEALLKYPNWTATQRTEVMNDRIRALEAVGDHPKLLEVLLLGTTDPKLATEAGAYKIKSTDVVENKLNQGELETLLSSGAAPSLRAIAAQRLGELALDAKDHSNAQSYFEKAVSLDRESDTGRRAAEILSQLEMLKKVESKSIGVVLPLTGKHAPIAQKTLRGIQMGLGLYGKNVSTFKLAVVDDESNPDRARQGVERLVKEDNVIAVIGSLLSKTASGVASKAAELGVPSLALSQKSGITDLGPTVHRNSLTSEMQVRWLAKQAMEEMGLRRFAVLYPNDAYGVEFANVFWDEVAARGGQVTAAQSYSPKETDFRYVIQRLVGTYYTDARADEYRARIRDQKENPKSKSVRSEKAENILPPLVDFDAVFIPDSAKALGQIAAMLSFNDVKGIKLLGTNLWNVPGIQKRAGNWSKDLLFVDSFVSTDPRYQNSAFVREYKAIFAEEPGIFELQGYDSALILRQLISQGATSRDSLNRSLSQLQGVPGALSRLSVGPDREIQRPLVALTLENGQVVPFRKKMTP